MGGGKLLIEFSKQNFTNISEIKLRDSSILTL
jgi:hypothetical protein